LIKPVSANPGAVQFAHVALDVAHHPPIGSDRGLHFDEIDLHTLDRDLPILDVGGVTEATKHRLEMHGRV